MNATTGSAKNDEPNPFRGRGITLRAHRGSFAVLFLCAATLSFFCDRAFATDDKKARRVLATYGFAADPSEQNARTLPWGWIDAKKDPARALVVGAPPPLARPALKFHAGIFLPTRLALLAGEHPLVATHNAALSLLAGGDDEGAWEMMESESESLKKVPRASVERRSFQLLRGQLALIRYARALKDETEKNGGQLSKEMPASVREWRMRVISSLSDALEYQDVAAMFAMPENGVDGALVRASLARGFFRDRPLSLEIDSTSLPSADRSRDWSLQGALSIAPLPLDPVRNLRTFAFATLWNLTVMQAEGGNWQSAFELARTTEDVADRLGPRAPVFAGESGQPFVSLYDVDTVENGLWMLPRVRDDMIASLSMLRAQASIIDRDPVSAFEFADAAIRKAKARTLAAAGFQLVGNVYFDLNNQALAEKVFGWAQDMSDSYARISPSLPFFRAENDFWRGKREEARARYENYLANFGDRIYGPWARLRLAALDAAAGDDERAIARYADIRRLTPKHPAALHALVRVFCTEERAPLKGSRPVGLSARLHLQSEVLASLSAAPTALQQEARACALGPTLERLAASGKGARAREAMALQAKERSEPLAAYDKDFPDSPYRALHEAEVKRLSLADGQGVLASYDCKRILTYFRLHDAALLKEDAGTLRWGSEEKKLVGRCAYLEGDAALWARARKEAWEPAMGDLQDRLAALAAASKAPNEKKLGGARALARARANLHEIIGTARSLTAMNQEKEDAGDLLLRVPEFWKLVAASKLAALELGYENKKSPTLDDGLRAKALVRKPATLWTDERQCLLAVTTFDSMAPSLRLTLFRSRPTSDWLALLASEDASCKGVLANRFLLATREGRMPALEEPLLLPWLGKRGVKGAPDAWLAYAQALERRKGPNSPAVRKVFKDLANEADDLLVKEAAAEWLEKNANASENQW